jgi:pimeloyl-ACP methyl ester carboxylesterase
MNAVYVRATNSPRREGDDRHLLEAFTGMSWGGSVTGAYVCENADKVRKLCLIAPQWIRDTPSRMDDGGKLGAYRVVGVAAVKDRWIGGVPESRRAGFLPDEWFEQ